MTTQPLLTLRIVEETDVFAVRQRGREVAAALGMERQDQVRVATALSEVGRETYAMGATVVTFVAAPGPPAQLIVDLAVAAAAPDAPLPGFAAASRLVDALQVSDASGTVVIRMTKRLPGPRLSADALRTASDRIRSLRPANALDELRAQNEQLLAALDDLQRSNDDLARLNEELAETNRGVVALYNQLSDELEQTNRGVVALYAELDDRSARLREASEAKSRFLRNVNHELRAPIASILGLLGLLLDPDGDPLTPDQRQQLTLANAAGHDLLGLVNQLLDLAKAESGRMERQIEPVELAAMVGQLRGTLQPIATNPAVELVIEEPPIRTVMTDERLLGHVLRNLLTNALKFTERGEVRLRVRPDGDDVVYEVSDTGIGLADDELDRIFEEFYQVRGPVQAKVTGTGLGLPFARRLAQRLGGTLTVRSELGVGSVFTLRLPAEAPVAEPVS